MAVWQLVSGTTYTDLPEPQEYSIDGEDLDFDTYRSCVNGNLIRTNIIGFKWQKAQFKFGFKTEEEARTLIAYVKDTYPLTIKCASPFGDDGTSELTGYVSKISCECKPYRVSNSLTALGYVVSFNFVEAIR